MRALIPQRPKLLSVRQLENVAQRIVAKRSKFRVRQWRPARSDDGLEDRLDHEAYGCCCGGHAAEPSVRIERTCWVRRCKSQWCRVEHVRTIRRERQHEHYLSTTSPTPTSPTLTTAAAAVDTEPIVNNSTVSPGRILPAANAAWRFTGLSAGPMLANCS